MGSLDVGSLDMANTATLLAEINGASAGIGYDQISVSGTGIVDIAGSTLSLSGAYNLGGSGDVFTLILNNSVNAVVGEFAGMPNGTTVNLGGQSFQISYFDNALTPGFEISGLGNDVSLLAIPEPGSAALLLGGLGSLIGFRRRRGRA